MAKQAKVTPKGTLRWAHLTTADTKFKAEGKYHTELLLDKKEAKPIIAECEAAIAKQFEEAKAECLKMSKDKKGKQPKATLCEDKPYFEDESGKMVFRFSMPASGTNKKTGENYTAKPRLFDATGQVITDTDIKIGTGTIAKISYEVRPFFTVKLGAGVSLRLRAVQIIKLVEWGGDGSYFGFGDEDSEFDEGDDEQGSEEESTEDAEEYPEEEESEAEPEPVKTKAAPANKAVKAKKVAVDEESESDF